MIIEVFSIVGLSSFVSQFPSIDPFRWSGWLLCILCLFLTAVNALYFVEQPSDINRKGTRLSIRKLKPAVPVYVSTLKSPIYYIYYIRTIS